MNYRYIYLIKKWPYSGFGEDFDSKFRYNTWTLCNFLSRHVRKLHLPTDGDYNLLSCAITKEKDHVRVCSVNCLDVSLHVSDSEIQRYLAMRSEQERFEFYFSLLERGYRLAALSHSVPIDDFLRLHQQFRDLGYRNEWLFKKVMLREYSIKVILEHVLTQYEYNLRLTVTTLKGEYVNSGSIYTTYPDDIFFNKNVRKEVVTESKLLVVDFLDYPQFECLLDDLAQGIIRSTCLDENTKLYIPNEDNIEKFRKLRWD